MLPINSIPSNPNSTNVVTNDSIHIPNEPELDPSSKNNELDPSTNTSPKTTATQPSQVYSRRRHLPLNPCIQESEMRPGNNSLSLLVLQMLTMILIYPFPLG